MLQKTVQTLVTDIINMPPLQGLGDGGGTFL